MNNQRPKMQDFTIQAEQSTAYVEPLAVCFVRARDEAAANAQRELCREIAQRENLHITRDFIAIDESAISFETCKNQGAMLHYLYRNRQITHIIAADLSRITRRSSEFDKPSKWFKELEVTLTMETEKIRFDNDPITEEA